MIGPDNIDADSLNTLRRIAADPTCVSDLNPDTVNELRIARLIYVVSAPAGTFAHPTRDKGREALERNKT